MSRPLGLALLLTLVLALPVASAPSNDPFRIAVIADGPWYRNAELRELFRDEVLELTRGEFDVRFPDETYVIADWSAEGVRTGLDRLLEDPRVDLVLTLGVIASHDAATRGPLPKPVVAPFVVDADAQGLPRAGEGSGVENLSYLNYPRTLRADLQAFREILPFERLTVLTNAVYLRAVPGLGAELSRIAGELGFAVTPVPVAFDVDAALAAIHPGTDAVYATPLLQLDREAFSELTDALIRRGLPSFSLLGETEVRMGILASTNPDLFPRLSRRVALTVQQILLGDDPAAIPVGFTGGRQWFVNMETARGIGLYPNWAILTEAETFGDAREEITRVLTFGSVVREALASNLDLAVADRRVAVARGEASEARSRLLPQVETALRSTWIDEDRAEASFGSTAERTLAGSATLTQLLYSDDAWTGYTARTHLAEAREHDRRADRLDVVSEAAVAYLDVLRAAAFERIQRENLKLTRTNLSLARVRRSVGSSGPSDVYRLESQIASNRKAAIEANAERNAAEIALNRVLNRPLEEPFRLEEPDLRTPGLLTGSDAFLEMISNKATFAQLRDVLTRAGLEGSPELAAYDAALAGREREATNARRSFVLPTLALQGRVEHRFDEGGAGSGPDAGPSLPPELPFTLDFPTPDETDWSVTLNLTYPLFSGGERFHRTRRTREELSRLELERAATRERIEQRIRTALHRAGASYAGIEQARLAAGAARDNLELVSDSYARGAVSIIQLLDAQNALLVADQSASNALYDFLADLVEVQRSITRFDLFASPESREEWMEDLQRMLDAAG